ncbi:Allergen Asp f [Lachnellula suecica]|uniref:Allergen Asp f n=1 Tax=Lachnellula suecica TaxID=602035 RepID=A0A8T9C8G7_9HELO|nr:Allergen Asp f [Lachnellula suecica]
MRYSTTSGMILAAMSIGEAVAGPTHAHLHRRAHEKKDVDYSNLNWDAMGIDWSSAWAAGQKTAAPAATAVASVVSAASPVVAAQLKASTTAAAATPSKSASASASAAATSSSSVESSVENLLGSLSGLSNKLTSFGAVTQGWGEVVGKVGNIGSPQGSNIIKVANREGYDFTNEFINTSGESMTINCWNKAAYWEGQPDTLNANLGASIAPKQTALTFSLAPGASQVIAFDNDSQGGCAQATTSTVFSGGFDTTWLEFNFANTGSGYDVSAIQNTNNNNYEMTITATETPCISDRTQNMWLTDSTPVGTSDGSCYVPGTTATLTTKMGGVV